MPLSPRERVLRAQGNAHQSWANTADRTARTAPGRAAMNEKFVDQVDPDRVLDPADRARRAESARRAHFKRLALKSARARRLRTEARRAGMPPAEGAA